MKKWQNFTSRELKAEGWLRRQLEIEAEGLCGNLDKVWRDVRDSAWIGGDAEGWERVPYWLDGFIPLAYLLDNADMIARAKRYIDAILASQGENGWICPCADENIPSYDTWAVQLISKVLVVYYECSRDDRIPDAVYRVMKNYYELLKSGRIKLFNWGEYRWYESFVAINFLRVRYREEWISDLGMILKEQGIDPEELTPNWHRPEYKWTFYTHIVNIAMMLKYEAISADILGEEYTDSAERLVRVLEKYNGTPVGTFTGDECLSGRSAIQGTELCAVVEQMYSYETLYAYTGDKKWAERLELLAFNALPATLSDDMWAHQYVQMSNQIATCRLPGRSLFRTNNSEAHLFGLEPNYGCCTANFGQGFPKLALSTFMYSGDTLLSAIPIPSSVSTEGYTVSLDTAYPFENTLRYKVEAKSPFTLAVRIPSFAKRLTVDGEERGACDELRFDFAEGEAREIVISFIAEPTLCQSYGDLWWVRCGSLVFSLPISYEKKMLEYERAGVERRYPYCDYEYIPTSEWSFALSSPELTREERSVGDFPFSSVEPPVVLRARVRPIVWGKESGFDTVAARVPESRTPIGDEREVELYPYGCAKLRMTELPLV